MRITGNWITPYFNGETRFDKPPLIYWLIAIGYQLIGVNEWEVRLPSALAAIALVIFGFFTLRYYGFATFGVAKSRSQQRQLLLSAWIGSALIAFNLQTILWARTGVSDMLLSGLIGSALFCFFWGYVYEEKKTRRLRGWGSGKKSLISFPNSWYLTFYILIALAVLSKGPIGVVLPGLIIFSFLLYIGKLRSVLQEMRIVWGGLLFLVITLPWYILVILENGQAYIDSFLGYHNFQRFTDVVNGHEAPWYIFYFPASEIDRNFLLHPKPDFLERQTLYPRYPFPAHATQCD